MTYCGALSAATTIRLIFGDAAFLAFGGGDCAITVPGSAPGKWRVVTEPTWSPRRLMFTSAACSLCPTRLGIAALCGPRLSATMTFHPLRTRVSGAGAWETI